MFHVFKMYNTKTENRATVTVKASEDSRSHAIDEVIRLHSKVVLGHWNKPKNWIIEKQLDNTTADIQNPNRPKAKSKQFKKR